MAQLVFPFKVANNKQQTTNSKHTITQQQLFNKIQLESNKLQTKLNQLQSTDTTMLSKFNQIQVRHTTMLTKLNQIQASINTQPLTAINVITSMNSDGNGTQYFRLLFSPELYKTILQNGINTAQIVSQPEGLNMVALNWYENPANYEGYVDATTNFQLTYETLFWSNNDSSLYTSPITLEFKFSRSNSSGMNDGYILPGIYSLSYIPFINLF